MANRIFEGTINSDFATAGNWDGGASVPANGDNLTAAAAWVLGGHDSNTYGTVTINALITADFSTYNFNCLYVTVNGTHKLGASSDTGFTCAGIAFNSGSVRDWQPDSKIYNSSDYWFLAGATFSVNANRGDYTQTNNGVFRNNVTYSSFTKITQNDGVTISNYQGSTGILGESGTTNATFNGILNTNGSTGSSGFAIRVSDTGTLTIGANFDILGGTAKNITWNTLTTASVIWNRTTALTYQGVFSFSANSSSSYGCFPAVDVRNSKISIGKAAGAARDRYLGFPGIGGTLKVRAISLSATDSHDYNLTIRQDLTNTNIEIYDTDFTLTKATGSANIIWLLGTGTIKYIGGTAGNIDYAGNSMEENIFDQVAAKSIVSNFTTKKISGTAAGTGSLISSVAGTQRVITCQEKGEHLGTLGIQDISFGAKGIAGGKSCRNLGNVKGFTFMDMSLSKVAM